MKNILAMFAENSIDQKQSVTIGSVKLTGAQEPVHTIVNGSTGVGKTTVIVEMLQTISARGDRMIIADPDGFYSSRFATEHDIILNDKIARSIVPDGHGADAAWHFYAQVLIADVMRSLMSNGKGTTAELIHALTTMPAEELKMLVASSASVGLFDKDAARALASTRFILASYLKPFAYLKDGDFGLRGFLESKRQRIFLTWREDMTASLAPLIACWIDVLCNAILSTTPKPVSDKRRTWLVLDELASLGKISSLESVLTKGRKHNLCCIAGLQSIAQLDRVYGKETSIILRSCFRNLVAFAIAKADPDTSEASQGSSSSVSVQRVRERLVLPSELNELPDLTAFLALAGDEPTRKIKLIHQNLPEICPSFVE
jgi:Type IV secretion-system coupling protein DNA-binding domain